MSSTLMIDLRHSILRGRVWSYRTADAGVAPGTSVGTTAAFALLNPTGSGFKLAILRVRLGYVSGTIGAGFIAGCQNTSVTAATLTGTAITAVNKLVGGNGTAAGLGYTTATLPAAPTSASALFSLGAKAAATALDPVTPQLDLGGEIILSPGTIWSLQGVTAAGSSPLVVFEVLVEQFSG